MPFAVEENKQSHGKEIGKLQKKGEKLMPEKAYIASLWPVTKRE